jgi:hypothetical protein
MINIGNIYTNGKENAEVINIEKVINMLGGKSFLSIKYKVGNEISISPLKSFRYFYPKKIR